MTEPGFRINRGGLDAFTRALRNLNATTTITSRTYYDIINNSTERQSTMTGITEQAEIVPIAPRKGAFIRVTETGELLHFKEWIDADTLTTKEDKTFKASEVEALTAAIYGKGYERACGMPASPNPGQIVKVASWRSVQPQVQPPGRASLTAWAANHVAALAPVLNPATESAEEKALRLERTLARVESAFHDRMVAEATARGWCPEFDVLLDATGLPPRAKTGVVVGTFTATINESEYGSVRDILDQVKASPFSYIPARSMVVTSIEAPDDENVGPLLSI